MGVKDLWTVLAPVGKPISLSELQGQTLAVDLSIWIVETQGVRQMQGTVTKPYLRNLFFRINHVLQQGINLVFVLEGEPPQLKWQTMQQRTQARFGHRRGRGKGAQVTCHRPKRTQFKSIMRECCQLLDEMGLPYVQSAGEAEAMCAFLNSQGVVDGCLTDDGDAFLYGARQVYRNFTMNSREAAVVESYSMTDVERHLGLGRRSLVGLGLLLGCDFVPAGVPGVGRETALKLFTELGTEDVLDRFQKWVQNKDALHKMDPVIYGKKVGHCTVCKHPGSARGHEREGCSLCGSDRHCEPQPYDYVCTCEWHRQLQQFTRHPTELAVQRKALTSPGFPWPEVIQEFLVAKDKVPRKQLLWKRPRLIPFIDLCELKMEWVRDYSREKLLPLMTLWDMRAHLRLHGNIKERPQLTPHSIVKSRVRQGIPCYEVHWHKLEEDDFSEDHYTTIEEADLFKKCFPEMVTAYEVAKPAKVSRKKAKALEKQTKEDVEDNKENFEDLDQMTATLASVHLTKDGYDSGEIPCKKDPMVPTDRNSQTLVDKGPEDKRMQSSNDKTSEVDRTITKDVGVKVSRPHSEFADKGDASSSSRTPSVITAWPEMYAETDIIIRQEECIRTREPITISSGEENNDDDDEYLPLSQRLALRNQRLHQEERTKRTGSVLDNQEACKSRVEEINMESRSVDMNMQEKKGEAPQERLSDDCIKVSQVETGRKPDVTTSGHSSEVAKDTRITDKGSVSYSPTGIGEGSHGIGAKGSGVINPASVDITKESTGEPISKKGSCMQHTEKEKQPSLSSVDTIQPQSVMKRRSTANGFSKKAGFPGRGARRGGRTSSRAWYDLLCLNFSSDDEEDLNIRSSSQELSRINSQHRNHKTNNTRDKCLKLGKNPVQQNGRIQNKHKNDERKLLRSEDNASQSTQSSLLPPDSHEEPDCKTEHVAEDTRTCPNSTESGRIKGEKTARLLAMSEIHEEPDCSDSFDLFDSSAVIHHDSVLSGDDPNRDRSGPALHDVMRTPDPRKTSSKNEPGGSNINNISKKSEPPFVQITETLLQTNGFDRKLIKQFGCNGNQPLQTTAPDVCNLDEPKATFIDTPYTSPAQEMKLHCHQVKDQERSEKNKISSEIVRSKDTLLLPLGRGEVGVCQKEGSAVRDEPTVVFIDTPCTSPLGSMPRDKASTLAKVAAINRFAEVKSLTNSQSDSSKHKSHCKDGTSVGTVKTVISKSTSSPCSEMTCDNAASSAASRTGWNKSQVGNFSIGDLLFDITSMSVTDSPKHGDSPISGSFHVYSPNSSLLTTHSRLSSSTPVANTGNNTKCIQGECISLTRGGTPSEFLTNLSLEPQLSGPEEAINEQNQPNKDVANSGFFKSRSSKARSPSHDVLESEAKYSLCAATTMDNSLTETTSPSLTIGNQSIPLGASFTHNHRSSLVSHLEITSPSLKNGDQFTPLGASFMHNHRSPFIKPMHSPSLRSLNQCELLTNSPMPLAERLLMRSKGIAVDSELLSQLSQPQVLHAGLTNLPPSTTYDHINDSDCIVLD